MRKIIKNLLALALCGTVLASSSCAVLDGILGAFGNKTQYTWSLTELGEEVDFHTEAQKNYLLGDLDNISAYAKGVAELSRPESVELSWKVTSTAETDLTVKEYTLEIAADNDFSDCWRYRTQETSYEVYNLQIATDYYWRVTSEFSDGTKSVSPLEVFSTTTIGPRNLYVDGITNVRDLGGWEREDGSRVKQGMIYRCGRLNESSASSPVVEITEEGKRVMLDELGIWTEIDLRLVTNNEIGSITSSPLGDSVNYYTCPMEWNVSNILTNNVEMVKQVFAILSDEQNYPVIYHCNIGTDRTGLFAFLINGLMGVSEEDLYRDYLFSNFGNIGGSRSTSGIKNSYVATIKNSEGSLLSEKIYNCLVKLGVPSADLDSVIELLSED